MRVVLAAIFALGLVAGCGDNRDRTCDPPGQLPTLQGELTTPFEMPLPPTCVEAGLVDLPGRWFVYAPAAQFTFQYPIFGGSCHDGLYRDYVELDDTVFGTDGLIAATYSDGTHFWRRTVRRYEIDGELVDYTNVFQACLLADGTMAAMFIAHDPDKGTRVDPAIGKRIGMRDAPALGLQRVGSRAIGSKGGAITGFNLVVVDQIAYVVGPTGLETIDVSDPALPRPLGHYDGSFNDVRVVKTATSTVAYASPRPQVQRTWMINVTDPTTPTLAGALPQYSHSVFTRTVGATTELYLATYSQAIPRWDVTDPLVPFPIGMTIVPGADGGVHDLFVDELDRIYANDTTSGLVVFDVSAGLDSPVELGRALIGYSHASWAGNVNGRRLILHGDEGWTATDGGAAYLTIFDGDPASPTFMQELSRYQSRPEVGIHNFEVHGNLVYIAYYQDGVRIVDLTDPTKPKEVAHYNTHDWRTAYGGGFEGALGIRKVGDLIYVADSYLGLVILKEI